jgi:hypothetical protein
MKNYSKSTLLFILLFTQIAISQTNENFLKISEKLENYFSLNREVISVHFNKSVYLTNEKIWFKGYVLNRNTKKINTSTTNVYGQLFNSQGEEVAKQLLFCFNGSFSGTEILDLKLPTGTYYFRFYTNYMNNFKEDESSMYPIEIINPFNEDYIAKSIQSHDLILNYHPEGGKIIRNTKNQIILELNDCLGQPIRNQEIILLNQKEEIILKTKLNTSGFGKLEFVPLNNESYKLKTVYQGNTFERAIDNIEEYGIGLTVNNVTLKDKCIIQLNTNEATMGRMIGEKIFIVVHQDEKAIIIEKIWEHQKTEQLIIVNNNDLADGVNTVRILDARFNEISNRNVYKHYKNDSINYNLRVENSDSEKKLTLTGPGLDNESNLSVSILPLNSIAKFNSQSIVSDVFIAPYVIEKKQNTNMLLKNMNRNKAFDLDLLLSAEIKQKYSWTDILAHKIEEKYENEVGINILGKVLNPIKNRANFKVQLYSFELNINEFSDIDTDLQFRFNNLILTDSTYLSFNLVKNFNEKSKLSATFNVENNKSVFNKKIVIKPYNCKIDEITNSFVENYKKPIIEDESVLELENVEVFASRSEQLLLNKNKNPALRGIKITDDTPFSEVGLLFFLERNGFVVDRNPSRPIMVQARNANATSINGADSKAMLFINDIQYRDYDILREILLGDVDEIYLSTSYLDPGINFFVGKIVIYTKGGSIGKTKRVIKHTDFVVQNGFSPRTKFKNNRYRATNDDGFENYGVNHWEPFLEQKEGIYSTQFNAIDRDRFFIQIEGISSEGKVISIHQILE